MSGINAVTALAICGASVFGMVLALLGSLKLALARHLNLGEGRVGTLLSALNLALIPATLLSGVLVDRWTVRGMIVVGSVVLALALLALSARPTFWRACASLLLAGCGAAALGTATVVLMPRAFTLGGQADLSAALNLGMTFFALGALVTPPLTDVLLRVAGLRRTLALLAFLCLVPALVAALPDASQIELPHMTGSFVLDQKTLWFAGLVFFLYSPLEASVSIWATTYLTDTGHPERGASWVLSGFWGMFLLSRLVAALAHHAGVIDSSWDGWLLVLASLVAAVVLGNLSGSSTRRSTWLGLLVMGFVIGPIFPTLVAMVFKRLPQEMGTAYGTLFAVGSTGSLILAPLVGLIARRRNVQTAMRIPMLLALVLTAVALVFALAGGPGDGGL